MKSVSQPAWKELSWYPTGSVYQQEAIYDDNLHVMSVPDLINMTGAEVEYDVMCL